MAECKMKENKARCNCTYEPCSRKGVCCDCISYHLDLGQVPACFFTADIEKTYNRSIENFVATYKKRA